MNSSRKRPPSGKPAVVCTTGPEEDDLDRRLSRSWLRLGAAAVFAGQGMVFSLAVNLTPPLYGSPAYWLVHLALALSAVFVMVFLGGPLLRATALMVRRRRLSIDGLFFLSLCGAFGGSVVGTLTGEGSVYYEVVAVVVAVHTVGRMVGERSQAKLRGESERLRETFDSALVEGVEGRTRMPLAEITPGTTVRVLPGEPFTVDGTVLDGTGAIEETALTGEPVPVVRRAGERVHAGTWSVDGSFVVRAEQLLGERQIDVLLDRLDAGPAHPSELQDQADELVQGFLPLVAGASVATAIYWSFMGTWTEAVLNSMAVLLIACPCALGLATPVAVWQGLFHLSTRGLVSRDGRLLDTLARTRRIFFDKTGTLSEPRLSVLDVVVGPSWHWRRERLASGLHALQQDLSHPVARALARHFEAGAACEPATCEVLEHRLIPGQGVEGRLCWDDGETFALTVGERSLVPAGLAAEGDRLLEQSHASGSKAVFVMVDTEVVAVALLGETLREGAEGIFEALAGMDVASTILTGDPNPRMAFPETVEVASGLSAGDKEARVRESSAAGERPVFVGDGINDAPALHAADGSIALDEGSGLARSAAGGELLGGNLALLPGAIRLARAIRRRLRGNLLYAACYNTLGMGLAATGNLHPVAAALIMLVSSFLVTARALQLPKSSV